MAFFSSSVAAKSSASLSMQAWSPAAAPLAISAAIMDCASQARISDLEKIPFWWSRLMSETIWPETMAPFSSSRCSSASMISWKSCLS